MPEHFNTGDAVAAWLQMDVDTLRATLDFFKERGTLKRARVGGTMQYFSAAGKADHARLLRQCLAKMPVDQEASAAH